MRDPFVFGYPSRQFVVRGRRFSAGPGVLSWDAYALSGRLPVRVLDFERGVYADNPVWWAEAPTQPADAVVFADFEMGRYAA